jgi:hypothetical protein
MILAFAIFFLRCIGFVQALIHLIRSGLMADSLLDTAASLTVEISTVVIMGELAFTAAKVKRLSKLDIG